MATQLDAYAYWFIHDGRDEAPRQAGGVAGEASRGLATGASSAEELREPSLHLDRFVVLSSLCATRVYSLGVTINSHMPLGHEKVSGSGAEDLRPPAATRKPFIGLSCEATTNEARAVIESPMTLLRASLDAGRPGERAREPVVRKNTHSARSRRRRASAARGATVRRRLPVGSAKNKPLKRKAWGFVS